MANHTPTPWALFDSGDFVYINEKGGPGFVCTVNVVSHDSEKCRANARHIVKCVNNHERLVEALQIAEMWVSAHAEQMAMYAIGDLVKTDLRNIRAVLAELDKGDE